MRKRRWCACNGERMATKQVAEVVSKVQQLAKPRYINGVWKKPIISGRKLAGIRRSLVLEGTDWPARPLRDRGGDKPFKLSRKEREREQRKKDIEENMRQMPQMVADYRKQRRELREATRRSREKTDEQKYLLATGKMKEEGPHWLMFKDKKR